MKQVNFPFTRCQFGVAVRDVTPPLGIYARSWGAALHDVMDGVHRPFNATAALFKAKVDGMELALVALDMGWFQDLDEERALRATIQERTGLEAQQLLINVSHTHAGPNLIGASSDKPGVEFVKPYLVHLANQISDAILEARNKLQDAWVAYGYGRCGMAKNRDYYDVDEKRWACGFNPEGHADDTVLVARVTNDAGKILATLVNYACHPTTLAWDNHLLSPDFIGATREILEREFGAPALFLQGASGDLGPREDYVGDAAVADMQGRQLGYAAAAALTALPPPAQTFVYTGILLSGADLGTWEYRGISDEQKESASELNAQTLEVELPRRDVLSVETMQERYAQETNRKEKERILRKLYIQRALGDSPVHRMPMWFWRLGDAAVVAVPNELYSSFQETLRAKFPDTPLIVMGVTNGTLGYLAPRETYGSGLYQEWQSPYAPGCLEKATAEAEKGVEGLFS